MTINAMHVVNSITEALLYLGIVTCCLVAVGCIAERFGCNAQHGRRTWNVVILGLILACLMEFAGLRHLALVGFPVAETGRTDVLVEETFAGGEHAVLDDWLIEAFNERPVASFASEFRESAPIPELDKDQGVGRLSNLNALLAAPNSEPDDGGLARQAASSLSIRKGQGAFTWLAEVVASKWMMTVGGVWMLGSCWLMLGHGACCLRLSRFSRSLDDLKDRSLRKRIDRMSARLGLRKPVRIYCGEAVVAPMAFGVQIPTLVLPASFLSEHDSEHQDAILAHELTHLAGRDSAWQHLSVTACALLWWHPFSWYAARRQRLAMEFAADEATAIVPRGPSHLADCLVTLGRRLTSQRQYGLGMAGPSFRSTLATRVQRLLDQSRRPATASPLRVRSGVVLGNSIIVLVFVLCIVASGWAMPPANIINEGDSEMKLVSHGWKRSLAAALVIGMLGPVTATAQEEEDVEVELDESAFEVEVEVDGDVEVRREIRRRREERRSLEDGARREADERREERVRDDRRRERIQERQVRDRDDRGNEEGRRAERAQLERKLRTLKRQLYSDSDADDDPAGQRERIHREIHELSQHLQRLNRADLADERHAQLSERRRVIGDQEQKLRHLQTAIENLLAAGLHEQAEHLEKLAQSLRRQPERSEMRNPPRDRVVEEIEIFRTPRQPRRPRPSASPNTPGVSQLRSEMETMRAEMREMHQLLQRLLERDRSQRGATSDSDA